ncbi:MAG: 5'-3' exonuclease H3TH domain-containing protein [Myxococcota bacterium]
MAGTKAGGASKPGPLVHLFDGHVYIFRAYFSMPSMTAADGTPCNAAYGFANTLIRYATEVDPSHVGVCFDAAMTSFRNEIEPEYKAQRGEPPEELEPQFDLCHEISVALGFATYEKDDYEADDLLGTISDEVIRRRGRSRVITTDKDLCQLVREDGRVEIYDLAKDLTYDADRVREKFGVSPHQIPDYLGLVGDVVDNLPGVPGVGAKSAAAVLQHFPSIEEVPSDVEAWADVEVRGAKRLAGKIAEHRERALKTKGLATVLRKVPGVSPGLSDLAYRGADRERTEELFERLGWNRIFDRIPKWQSE